MNETELMCQLTIKIVAFDCFILSDRKKYMSVYEWIKHETIIEYNLLQFSKKN